jgi:hypothetical protein
MDSLAISSRSFLNEGQRGFPPFSYQWLRGDFQFAGGFHQTRVLSPAVIYNDEIFRFEENMGVSI